MKGSLTVGSNRTGGAGIITDIGKDEERGGFRAINLQHHNTDRN
jgi:hypothetical protein